MTLASAALLALAHPAAAPVLGAASVALPGAPFVAAASPSPSPSPTAPGFGPAPSDQRPGSGDSVSAGLYGFLFVVALAVALALLVWSMNRSLKRARRNLGGSTLPRQAGDQVPVTPKDD